MKKIDETLLAWYDQNARLLPWRGTKDPYRIWLSEIMLQQTRAETVKAYYARFTERFDSVFSLADADIDEVLKLWEGLGYYSRARNLHKAAKIIAESGGIFPNTIEGLEKLPGIGLYAARAIASIAWNECAPALDGNQMRVLSRLMGITRILKTPFDIEAEAMELISRDRPGDYNQALMDLGAGVCLPKNPHCEICPLKEMCIAYADGEAEFYPRRPVPTAKKEENRTMFLIECNGGICIHRRSEGGLLGGLYEFPSAREHLSEAEAVAALARMGFVKPQIQCKLPDSKHIFTHLIWKMWGYFCHAEKAPAGIIISHATDFFDRAFPTALRKYHEIAKDAIISAEFSDGSSIESTDEL